MDLLFKTPSEDDLFGHDFSSRLSDGEWIVSLTSFTADTPTDADPLTITGATFSATESQARISGGTAGFTYHVTAKVVTNLGNVLEGCGNLEVKNC
jgi:hypothetical protein